MSDKPFDPVTEGTPFEIACMVRGKGRLLDERANCQVAADIIAARDAAMLKKGEEKGRLKGLEEAAGIVGDLDVPREKACWNYTDGFKDGRHKAEQAIRAAAETAKEGGDEG